MPNLHLPLSLEQQILNDVGTYGRQLGQMGDALAVLLRHVKLDSLEPAEKQAIAAFQYQLDEIARLKAKRRPAQKQPVLP